MLRRLGPFTPPGCTGAMQPSTAPRIRLRNQPPPQSHAIRAQIGTSGDAAHFAVVVAVRSEADAAVVVARARSAAETMADWLVEFGVTLAGMESTARYGWRFLRLRIG